MNCFKLITHSSLTPFLQLLTAGHLRLCQSLFQTVSESWPFKAITWYCWKGLRRFASRTESMIANGLQREHLRLGKVPDVLRVKSSLTGFPSSCFYEKKYKEMLGWLI